MNSAKTGKVNWLLRSAVLALAGLTLAGSGAMYYWYGESMLALAQTAADRNLFEWLIAGKKVFVTAGIVLLLIAFLAVRYGPDTN